MHRVNAMSRLELCCRKLRDAKKLEEALSLESSEEYGLAYTLTLDFQTPELRPNNFQWFE